MALFIRDEAADSLEVELQKALKTTTKKDAVRVALENELERVKRQRTRAAGITELQEKIAALGPSDPDFNMKRFTDEMWGDI